MSYEAAMEFVSTSPTSDEGCIEMLNVLIKGMETFNHECAEANFEADCAACQASVIIRSLRKERDDWLIDLGVCTREEAEQRRAAHQAKLIAETAAFMAEWEAENEPL